MPYKTASDVFKTLKKISDLGPQRREEKDGRHEEDTVVARSLLKYYRDRDMECPAWLEASSSAPADSRSRYSAETMAAGGGVRPVAVRRANPGASSGQPGANGQSGAMAGRQRAQSRFANNNSTNVRGGGGPGTRRTAGGSQGQEGIVRGVSRTRSRFGAGPSSRAPQPSRFG